MKREPQDYTLVRSYHLGELREEEVDWLEQRLLAEDELFELAEAVEAELLADAARGDLAPAERERVLQRLASSSQGRERLALARSLNEEADKGGVVVPFRRRVLPPAIRWAALAASLLVLPGLVWFALYNGEKAPNNKQHLAATPTPTSQKPYVPEITPPENRPVETTPKPPEPKSIAPLIDVVTIILGRLRGADEKVAELHLSPGSHMAELQIDIEGRDAKSFAVVIHRDRDERTIWKEIALKPTEISGGPMLVVHVPAKKLSAGRYEVSVTPKGESEEMAESQVFQVVKKKH